MAIGTMPEMGATRYFVAILPHEGKKGKENNKGKLAVYIRRLLAGDVEATTTPGWFPASTSHFSDLSFVSGERIET
jgi:hypothetical protein